MIARVGLFGRSGRLALVAALFGSLLVSRASAQVEESEFRAADGTTYQVIRAETLGGGADELQITTIAGAIAFYGTTGRSIGLKALPFGLLQYRSRNIAPLLRLYLTGSGNQW